MTPLVLALVVVGPGVALVGALIAGEWIAERWGK